MPILHVWPTVEDFDTVIISTQYESSWSPANRQPRDKVFSMLSHPAFRSIYEDVVYHA